MLTHSGKPAVPANGVCQPVIWHHWRQEVRVASLMSKVKHARLRTLHGDYRQYYYNGGVQIEGVYNKGHYERSWVYYDENGKVVGNGNFTAGSGVQKAWWPNGQLKRETN